MGEDEMQSTDGIVHDGDREIRAYRGVVIEGPGFALAYHSTREAHEALDQLITAMRGDPLVRPAVRDLELALAALDDLKARERRANVVSSAGPSGLAAAEVPGDAPEDEGPATDRDLHAFRDEPTDPGAGPSR
jgi:hypothetical protein